MLSWFRPSCPCDGPAKDWVERRLAWLDREFGDGPFHGAPVVLPTPEFFPEPYDGSRDALDAVFGRVCGFMGVPTRWVRLVVVDSRDDLHLVNDAGHALPRAAGEFEEGGRRARVSIERSELLDPVDLVATLAHELAHFRLHAEDRLAGEEWDEELLTDLAVVFFGLGVFAANSPRVWRSGYTTWPGTELPRPEYMTPVMFGYALAHLAWWRGERKPAWSSYVDWTARANLVQGLRFLWKTGQSAFSPAQAGHEP